MSNQAQLDGVYSVPRGVYTPAKEYKLAITKIYSYCQMESFIKKKKKLLQLKLPLLSFLPSTFYIPPL